jgi:archaeal flagellin FlaB
MYSGKANEGKDLAADTMAPGLSRAESSERRKGMNTFKISEIQRAQKGITGLETAIILIAFVVVASVFAYTVLSAGLFSTQKSQEAIYRGLEDTQSTIEQSGSVIAYKGDANIDSSVGKVEITIKSALQGAEAVDLTPPYTLAGGALVTSGMDSPATITYSDSSLTIASCAWTLDFIGNNNDDYYLDTNEKAVITVWLHDYDGTDWSDGTLDPFLADSYVETDHTFTLEVKAAKGAVLTIQRTTPAYLDTVMDLH